MVRCSSIEPMGMYDEIRCEYPLPHSGYRVLTGHTFQTKSLECCLNNYTITADGLLILHKVRGERVPEEERPYYGTPEWDNLRCRVAGSIRTVPVGDEEIAYHGDIHFYDDFGVREETIRVWIEYKARFTEGRLSRIEVEDVHELPPTKTIELGGREYPASESDSGLIVIRAGEQAEVARETNE